MAGGKHEQHRKRGSGSIRALPSGRYQARILIDGKYVSAPETFDSKVDARAWLARATREVAKGVFVPPAKHRTPPQQPVTLSVYVEQWLAGRPVKPRTEQEYRGLLGRHILPVLGEVPVAGLTPQMVRSWHAGCAPGAPATRVKAYSLLRTVLATAEEDEVIGRNPCRLRGAGTPPPPQVRPIPTATQIAELVEAMGDHGVAVVLAAWGGLRLGEVLGLRGSDIVDGVVHVRRSAVAVRGGAALGTPKSRAGVRAVVMPPHVLPLLEAASRVEGLLFPSASDPGRPLATVQFYKVWHPARRAVGLPDLRFHDLRHFAGTSAAQAGATVAELMARLGHTSPAVAMRYQHAERDALVAERLSGLAGG